MGVNRLWDILLTVAASKSLSDLSGSVLAIDASIWVVKTSILYEQQSQQNRCLLNKILWFLKNNIKPVFVFDGIAPSLKRKTLELRRQRRRQLAQHQLSKKAEIEILRSLNNPSETKDKDAQSKKQIRQRIEEIDKMMTQLLTAEQISDNTLQHEEKVQMQSRVLNKKYQLFCQISAMIQSIHGSQEDFCKLNIEDKESVLSAIEQTELPNGQLRAMKQTMTEQEKLIYEMELLKKKSEIRKLQDDLYRRISTKKEEDGYQIIQGIHNGKKVIQKRRIKGKDDGFAQWAIGSKSRKPRMNDFREIFHHSRELEQNVGDKAEQQGNNNFFNKIFTEDYNSTRQSSESESLQTYSQRLSQRISIEKPALKSSKKCQNLYYRKQRFLSMGQYIDDSSSQPHQQAQKQQSDDLQLLFESAEVLQSAKRSSNRQKQDNLDEFPDYVKIEELEQNQTARGCFQLQNLLDILGIAYIVAPCEAEAQCAYLEAQGYVDGVVTEDSDVFLFGARRVYRGVFQDNIKFYSMQNIQEKLQLSREKMILFAMMLGCDYTEGIKGIGIVNAMEILKVYEDIDALTKFTHWAQNSDLFLEDEHKTQNILTTQLSETERQFYQLHKKYKNLWYVHPDFPSRAVHQAFMKPDVIQESQLHRKFGSQKPKNLQVLAQVMKQTLGMSDKETEHNIKIANMKFERRVQQSLTEFLSTGSFAKIKSKRLQKAVNNS